MMIKKSISMVVACAAIVYVSNAAFAGVSLTATLGGAAGAGANGYENFDNFSLGSTAQVGDTGIAVSFVAGSPNGGEAVMGATNAVNAAPVLSGINGTFFGPGQTTQANGTDATVYLTSGTGQVVMDLGAEYSYFGLLWGSVDLYNTLEFYRDDNTLLGSITGGQVIAGATGDQGASGTRYVNIFADSNFDGFRYVVAKSTQNAFEFDNVAFGFSDAVSEVPEPASLAMWGLAALGAFGRRKLRRSSAV